MKDKNNDKGLFKHFYEHPIFFITFESWVGCYFILFSISNRPLFQATFTWFNLEVNKLDFSAASEIANMALQMAVEQASLEAPVKTLHPPNWMIRIDRKLIIISEWPNDF